MPRPRLAACGFFAEETPYLREWVEFHRIVGFDHFLMFCNDHDPAGAWDVLRPYERMGLATLVHWPGRPAMQRQMDAYLQACRCRLADWIAFIDLDEFVVPKDRPTVPELLEDFSHADGLVLNWRVYGTSGHLQPKPVQVESFLWCPAEGAFNHEWVKSIVRPERVVGVWDPHRFAFRDGGHCVDEMGLRADAGNRIPSTHARGQVNHYITRSRADCLAKMRKWAANDPSQKKGMEYIEAHDKAELFDGSALPFLPRLLDRLAHQPER